MDRRAERNRVAGMKNELLAKLNSKYTNSEITRLANAGDWAGAQNAAAGLAMWGIWEQIGQAAELPHSAADRQAIIDAYMARRAARLAKK